MQQECKIQIKNQLQSPFHALLSFQNYSETAQFPKWTKMILKSCWLLQIQLSKLMFDGTSYCKWAFWGGHIEFQGCKVRKIPLSSKCLLSFKNEECKEVDYDINQDRGHNLSLTPQNK